MYNKMINFLVIDLLFAICVTFLFQKIDVTNKAVTELLSKSTEYLQPNPGRIGTIGVGFCLTLSSYLEIHPS